jgi:hypothetical protein
MPAHGVVEDPSGAASWKRGGWAFKFERGPESDQVKMYDSMSVIVD